MGDFYFYRSVIRSSPPTQGIGCLPVNDMTPDRRELVNPDRMKKSMS
jgi:hypothetical protein